MACHILHVSQQGCSEEEKRDLEKPLDEVQTAGM